MPSNNISKLETLKQLGDAFSGENKNEQRSEIFHADTNSLEVIEEKTFSMAQKKDAPLFTEAEVFAMLRNQRRK